jgi:hypothetical protein
MKLAWIAAAILLIAPPVLARQAEIDPRPAVSQIAQALQDRYFDPARGAEIADTLRAEAAEGRYDSLTDPRDLQEALTNRLKPLDAHFNVSWRDPSATPAPVRADALESVPFEIGVSRRGQGFRAVEILPGNIAVVDMRIFAGFETADAPARRQVDAVLQLISSADAVIFDVRDNGGGSPAMVGYLVSAFVAPGADIYNTFHRRNGQSSERAREEYANPRLDVPLYVVVSGRSASAAEAFSYTLQFARRATIVGERSAGAANPGGPVGTPSGFSIFVPDGSPRNPITGRNWEGTGVLPDIEAPSGDALTVAWKAALKAQEGRLSGPVAVEARWVLEALNAPDMSVDTADYPAAYSGRQIEVVDGALQYRSGRRPAWRLKPLAPDVFFNREEPALRIRFERDDAGRVTALEVLDSQTGGARYFRRGE